jgi:hypothetical protein
MWHNARPRKVEALTWLTLNNGLLVDTWLQTMGFQAPALANVLTYNHNNLDVAWSPAS